MEYKVLPLWQPWAQLLFIINRNTGKPFKQYETRSKAIKPGDYLIHACLKWNRRMFDMCVGVGGFRYALKEHFGMQKQDTFGANTLKLQKHITEDLPFGAIIGRVTIGMSGEVIRSNPAKREATLFFPEKTGSAQVVNISGYEYDFGNYNMGRFGIEVISPLLFEKPIPFKASQGISKYISDTVLY